MPQDIQELALRNYLLGGDTGWLLTTLALFIVAGFFVVPQLTGHVLPPARGSASWGPCGSWWPSYCCA
jgi:hypothetical protein